MHRGSQRSWVQNRSGKANAERADDADDAVTANSFVVQRPLRHSANSAFILFGTEQQILRFAQDDKGKPQDDKAVLRALRALSVLRGETLQEFPKDPSA